MYCHMCGTKAAAENAYYCHACGTELITHALQDNRVCVCKIYGKRYCDVHKDELDEIKKQQVQKQPKATPPARKSTRASSKPCKPCSTCGEPTTAETKYWTDGARKTITDYRTCDTCVAQGKGNYAFAC